MILAVSTEVTNSLNILAQTNNDSDQSYSSQIMNLTNQTQNDTVDENLNDISGSIASLPDLGCRRSAGFFCSNR
jgi:hypothetical protein